MLIKGKKVFKREMEKKEKKKKSVKNLVSKASPFQPNDISPRR
jgi:hypothetical protein